MVLTVTGVTVQFGGVRALDDVTFSVLDAEICALIGPNGAGKTTLLNTLTGIVEPQRGQITLDDLDVTRTRRSDLVSNGLARTFQNLALFPTMSVLDNVKLGGHSMKSASLIEEALRVGRTRKSESAINARCQEVMKLLGVWDLRDRAVDALPFGILKRVELARALVPRPRVLLMDEPAAGLTHAEARELGDIVVDVRNTNLTAVLLVEHHMKLVMSISDHVVALDFGRVIADGSPHEVSNDPAVVAAYLGSSVS